MRIARSAGLAGERLEIEITVPFDKIRIDRMFASEMHDGGEGDAIVRAIVAAGQRLCADRP